MNIITTIKVLREKARVAELMNKEIAELAGKVLESFDGDKEESVGTMPEKRERRQRSDAGIPRGAKFSRSTRENMSGKILSVDESKDIEKELSVLHTVRGLGVPRIAKEIGCTKQVISDHLNGGRAHNTGRRISGFKSGLADKIHAYYKEVMGVA